MSDPLADVGGKTESPTHPTSKVNDGRLHLSQLVQRSQLLWF